MPLQTQAYHILRSARIATRPRTYGLVHLLNLRCVRGRKNELPAERPAHSSANVNAVIVVPLHAGLTCQRPVLGEAHISLNAPPAAHTPSSGKRNLIDVRPDKHSAPGGQPMKIGSCQITSLKCVG